MNTTTVDILRHGEVEGGSKYRGWQDDPLTENGWQQMKNALSADNYWDVIVSSPLSRCALFSKEYVTKYPCEYVEDERIKELHFGEWEGKTAESLMKTDKDRLQNFWQDPVNHSPPGGESLKIFSDRIHSVWDDLKQQYQGKNILLISHAGVIRMLFHKIAAVPLDSIFNIDVPEACLTRFEVQHGQNGESESLIFHNGRL